MKRALEGEYVKTVNTFEWALQGSHLTFNELLFNFTLKQVKYIESSSCVTLTKLFQLCEKWVFLILQTGEHPISHG